MIAITAMVERARAIPEEGEQWRIVLRKQQANSTTREMVASAQKQIAVVQAVAGESVNSEFFVAGLQ
ncbi:MAG: hypothetical protein L0Z53_17280 [Acidobacteriales bacterium]|nr:hypothetical protein [Terriglobales bacterium]